jgi:hypothetical protein
VDLLTALAAAAPAPVGVVARGDALAMSLGSRVSVLTLVVASIVTIAIGAASLLGSLRDMESELKQMRGELAVAVDGTETLNVRMDNVPKMASQMEVITSTVDATAKQVTASKESVAAMADSAGNMSASVADVTTDTKKMAGHINAVSDTSEKIAGTVEKLDRQLVPLARRQRSLVGSASQTADYLCTMNGSLAYVLRITNFLTKPPTGGPFTSRVEIDKAALPPIPGVKATAAPVKVFERGAWPVYNERGPKSRMC